MNADIVASHLPTLARPVDRKLTRRLPKHLPLPGVRTDRGVRAVVEQGAGELFVAVPSCPVQSRASVAGHSVDIRPQGKQQVTGPNLPGFVGGERHGHHMQAPAPVNAVCGSGG